MAAPKNDLPKKGMAKEATAAAAATGQLSHDWIAKKRLLIFSI